MFISIKLTAIPIISLTIMILLGILLYKIFSKKSSRISILYIAISILLVFGLLVEMNFKNEKGEYYWKSVNESEKKK